MTGEDLMDWECGYYNQFEQELHEGLIKVSDLQKLFNEKKITEYQYRYGIEYLTED